MADNILSGKVVITAPGVEATFAGISDNVAKSARSIAAFGGGVNKFIPPATAVVKSFGASFLPIPVAAEKAGKAIKGISTTSSAATQSLVNLSRVAQDAPFGFIGIANNLNPLLESFQRLKASTGSTGGALSALKKELTGAGGIGLALGVVSSLLVVFGDKLFGTAASLSKAEVAFGKLSSAVNQLGNILDETKRKLDFSVELQKLNLQLSGLSGKSLEIGGIKVERDANIKFIEDASNALGKLEKSKAVFDKFRDGILSAGNAVKQIGGKEGALGQLLRSFSDVTQIPESLISKLSTKDAAALKQYQQIAKAVIETKNKIELAFEKDVLLGKQSLVKQLPEIKTGTLKINPEKIEIRSLGPLELPTFFDIQNEDTRSRFKKQLDEFSDKFQNTVKVGIDLSIPQKGVRNAQEAANAAAAAIRKPFEELSISISNALSESFSGAFESLGEGLGNLLSGNDFGKQFSQVFGNLFNTIGKALIKFGIVKEGIDKLLGPGGIVIPGGVAIGLGIFAIAAGQLIKGISGARAAGGPVSGGKTYLVGERGPELFTPNTGGQIIPNDRLGSGRGFASGGMAVRVTGEFLQRGKDLLAVITLADQSKARLQ